MGMLSFLFAGGELKKLADDVVGEFSDSFPPASKLHNTDKKMQKKLDKALARMHSGLTSYLEKNRLSVYRKARLINMILVGIEALGYDRDVLGIVKSKITTVISLS